MLCFWADDDVNAGIADVPETSESSLAQLAVPPSPPEENVIASSLPETMDQKLELLRKTKVEAKVTAERERLQLLEKDAERVANEEAQKQERWRLKEMARVQRQTAKQEAEREAARHAQEAEKKKKQEAEEQARLEEESYNELLRQMASRGLKVPEPAKSAPLKPEPSAAANALSKMLEKKLEDEKQSESALSVKPLGAKAHEVATGVKPPTLGFVEDGISPFHFSDTGSEDMSESGSPKQQLSLAMMLQTRFQSTSVTPASTPTATPVPITDGLVLGSRDAVRPAFVHVQSADSIASQLSLNSISDDNRTISTGRTPEIPVTAYATAEKQELLTELKLTVKDVRLPTPVLLRRLRLWALTEGFLFTSAAEFDKTKFDRELQSATDVSLKGCKVDIRAIEDWNHLIDALRASERANNADTPTVLQSSKAIEMELEAALYPRGMSNTIVKPFSTTKVSAHFEDSIDSIAKKVGYPWHIPRCCS
jgi:chemotaxis protein histidine kinase CheA